MGKRVLVISTSLRKGGNSETLADEFIKGAKEAGHEVEKISLSGKKIGFCQGCLACLKTGACVLKDDANRIAEQVFNEDVLVFATPVYYYEMSGQMKTLIDRLNPLYGSEYRFRQVYLLATSADEDERSMDGAVKGLQGFVDCFERAELSGVVRGTGADGIGEIKNRPEALRAAYEMGRSVG